MVDVTVLLYLPIDTSLDDLAFVADWGQKIVAAAEEKMIINGKHTRYLRQRVMPMMYNPNNEIRPINKPKTRENTESWLQLLRKQDKEALPSWVKNHDLLENNDSEDTTQDTNPTHKLGKQNTGNKYETTNQNSNTNSKSEEHQKLCDCAPNRKNYLDVIREAVQFTYVAPENNLSCFTGSQENILSDTDSVFSDNSCPTSPVSDRRKNSFKNGSSQSLQSDHSQNSDGQQSNPDSIFSVKSNYSNHELMAQHQMKELNLKSTSHQSNTSSIEDSQNSQNSNTSSKMSTHTISHNKHVILSVATGYDRDSMKEVRKVINETGVALLSVGIGDRGMIGLGGYYIKKLHELEDTSLQNKIITRLWNLA